MRPSNALILSLVAGVMTFGAQHYFFPAELHAAAFVVPKSADWRQQMIDRDPGGAMVDQALGRLTDRLALDPAQVEKFRPLLESQHERILALLLTGPPSLTREQFLTERRKISEETHRQLDALLTPDQLKIAREMHPPPTPELILPGVGQALELEIGAKREAVRSESASGR